MIVIDHIETDPAEVALKLALLDEAFGRCHGGDVPATRSDDTDPAELIDAGREWLERRAGDLISDLEFARLGDPAKRHGRAEAIGVGLLTAWERFTEEQK